MVTLDPRIRRTRRALQGALLDLIVNRPLEDISIQDITDQAEMNRATFYLHYKSREELALQALDGLFENLLSEATRLNMPNDCGDPETVPSFLVFMFEYMNERKPLFRALLAHDTPTLLGDRLRLFQERGFLTTWTNMGNKPLPDGPPPELRASASSSAALGMISWWLVNEEAVPPAIMARWVWTLGSHYLFKDVLPQRE